MRRRAAVAECVAWVVSVIVGSRGLALVPDVCVLVVGEQGNNSYPGCIVGGAAGAQAAQPQGGGTA